MKNLKVRMKKANKKVGKNKPLVNKVPKSLRGNLKFTAKLIEELTPSITDEHIRAMRRTPFFNLFNAFHKGWIDPNRQKHSGFSILEVLLTYQSDGDENAVGFKLANKILKITARDISVILGMKLDGKQKMAFPKRSDVDYNKCAFCRTYFQGKSSLSIGEIEEHLKRIVGTQGLENDFVKLIILHMAGTFLFQTQAGGSVAVSFTLLLKSYRKMNKVSWPKTILEYMMDKIEKNKNTPINSSGALILLPFWLCEHTNICERIQVSEERFPRIATWSIDTLGKDLVNKIENLPDPNVNEDFIKPLTYEELLLLVDNEEEEEEEVDEEMQDLKKENERLKLVADNLLKEKTAIVEKLEVAETKIGEEQVQKNELVKEVHELKLKLEEANAKIKELKDSLYHVNLETSDYASAGNQDTPDREVDEEMAVDDSQQSEEPVVDATKTGEFDKEMEVDGEQHSEEPVFEATRTEELVEERTEEPVEERTEVQERTEEPVVDEQQEEEEKEIQIVFKTKAGRRKVIVKPTSMTNRLKTKTRTVKQLDDDFTTFPPAKKKKINEKKDEQRLKEQAIKVKESKKVQKKSDKGKGKMEEIQLDPKKKVFSNWNKTSVWEKMKETEKSSVLVFHSVATPTTTVWYVADLNISITGDVLDDLMTNSYVDGQVIDWYAHQLQKKKPENLLDPIPNAVFFRTYLWSLLKDDVNQENIEAALDNVIKTVTDETDILFFPFNSGKDEETKKEGYHWSLLVYLISEDIWLHYNSAKPRNTKDDQCYKEAGKLQAFVLKALNKHCVLERSPRKMKRIKRVNCPQQKLTCDCALFVCKFMKWNMNLRIDKAHKGEIPDMEHRTQRLRAKLVYKLLNDYPISWTMDGDPDVLLKYSFE